MRDIVLVGAGGHARSVVDSIEGAGELRITGFVDNDPSCEYRGYRVVGSDEDLPSLLEGGIALAAVCVGFLGAGDTRARLADKLREIGFALPAVVDPSAAVAKDALVGEGAFIGKCAAVNSSARIGGLAIVNSGAVVEHDCAIGECSHVSVNAAVCGGSSIGSRTLVGAGATVIQGVRVGNGCTVGAGAVVLADVPDGSTVVGVYNGRQ